jgi:simple sugar transport system permease protein
MLHRAIVYGTPLLLATVGEIYAERSGVLNLGVEGMMSIGAVVAFGVSLSTGNAWLGVMAAAAAAGALSLVHGFASINLRANQVVSGLALTMLGLGISGLLGKAYVGRPPGATIKGVEIPFLSEVPFLGKILFNQDPLVYASIAIAIVGWFVLFRTRLGLNIRSCGENPGAADVSGISVYRIRHLSVFLGGLLAGLAGAYLSLVYVPSWTQGLTGGRGWIVIGLTIFAFWKPLRAIAAAYLFGLLFVLPYRLQPLGVHTSLLQTLPYIVTVIALVVLSRESIRKRMAAPGALTTPYVREEI